MRAAIDTPSQRLAIALALVGLGWIITGWTNEPTQILILRSSATLTMLVLLPAFISPARQADQRVLTTLAGWSHAFHLGAIAAHLSESWGPALEIVPVVIGALGYVAVACLLLVDLPRDRYGAALWYVWFVLFATYAGNAADRPMTSGLLAVVMIVGGGVRIGSTLRTKRGQP